VPARSRGEAIEMIVLLEDFLRVQVRFRFFRPSVVAKKIIIGADREKHGRRIEARAAPEEGKRIR